MAKLEEYKTSCPNATLERDDAGVLTVRLHTNNGPLWMTDEGQSALADLWTQMADDPDSRAVVLTGTGEAFVKGALPSGGAKDLQAVEARASETRRFLLRFLQIGLPVVAAVNGPARAKAEIVPCCDLVVMADDAEFQDARLLESGIPPLDGAPSVWMSALGHQRGKRFLLSGDPLSAADALAYGAVNELLPAGEVLARAQELARRLAERPAIAAKKSHAALTQTLHRRIRREIDAALAFQTIAAMDRYSAAGGNK